MGNTLNNRDNKKTGGETSALPTTPQGKGGSLGNTTAGCPAFISSTVGSLLCSSPSRRQIGPNRLSVKATSAGSGGPRGQGSASLVMHAVGGNEGHIQGAVGGWGRGAIVRKQSQACGLGHESEGFSRGARVEEASDSERAAGDSCRTTTGCAGEGRRKSD